MFGDEECFGEIISSSFINNKLYYRTVYEDGDFATISHRKVQKLIELSKNVPRCLIRSKKRTTDT